MTQRFLLAAVAVITCGAIHAQGRASNWPTSGGDAQRSGWERADPRITKETVKDLQLLWKMKLENQPRGQRTLMPPLIVGNLISYRGFKELAFVAANSDVIYAIDADLGKMFWTKHLEYASLDPQVTGSSPACPGGLTAIPTMPPAAVAGRGGAPGGGAAAARGPVPAAARGGAPAGAAAPAPAAASVYAISGDGRLHRLNISTGDDVVQPVKVLPSNATAYSLNMADNVIYTVTSHDCNGAPNAVWAVDLMPDPLKTASAPLAGAGAVLGGVAIGANGGTDAMIYAQTSEKLLALSAKDLQIKQDFALPGSSVEGASPLVFMHEDRELIVSAGKDGRLYLLDSASLGGGTPLYKTPVIASNIGGNLSSWQDADGTRWILLPVFGALRPDFKVPGVNGSTPNGCILAFKLDVQDGKTVLTPAWASRDIGSPEPAVIASGVVFALTPGGSHATLYALDAVTGKELYSSRNLVTAPAALTGMTVANGRVYFGTTDGTLYAFGMYMEH